MKSKEIRRIVQEELAKATVQSGVVLPQGYNPLEVIRNGMFHWVAVPFNGTAAWCELRALNATQIRSCGDYSNIIRGEGKNLTIQQMIDLRNYQEKLIRLAMNRPAYDEIAALVDENDFVISAKRKELEEIKKTDLSGLPETERKELESRIKSTELFLGFILPEDTFGFLTSWINGADVSDIKKISDDQFLEAAILAENGHDNPTDHLDGVFTDHNRTDLDRCAWGRLAEYRKNQGIEAHAGRKVIGGPKK